MLIKKEDVGLSRKLLKEYKEQLNCLSSDQLEISIGLCLGLGLGLGLGSDRIKNNQKR